MPADADHDAALLGYLTTATQALRADDHAHAAHLARIAEGLWGADDPEVAMRALEMAVALRARAPVEAA